MSTEVLSFGVKRAAELSGLSVPTINRAVYDKVLPSIKIGGRRLILYSDFKSWLEASKPKAP